MRAAASTAIHRPIVTKRETMAAAAMALVAVLAACSAKADVPELERLAQQVNKGVMCPLCPGESIDQSQNPLAVQMRGIV